MLIIVIKQNYPPLHYLRLIHPNSRLPTISSGCYQSALCTSNNVVVVVISQNEKSDLQITLAILRLVRRFSGSFLRCWYILQILWLRFPDSLIRYCLQLTQLHGICFQEKLVMLSCPFRQQMQYWKYAPQTTLPSHLCEI